MDVTAKRLRRSAGQLVGKLVGPQEELVGGLDLAGLEQEPRHRERELGVAVDDIRGDL